MKKIIAIMLMLAMLMSGCGKVDSAEPTDATTESTAGTGGITEATEPREATEPTKETAEPTSEATEPTIEEPTEPVTDPEPDPYADIKFYPFPLLDMTVAEIEAAYGELEWSYGITGGNPVVYRIPSLDMEISYIIDLEKHDGKNLPKDMKPYWIWYENATIYPGISVGMTPDQIPKGIEWLEPGLANTGEGNYGYYAYYNVYEAGSFIRVNFAIPDHILEEYPPVYGFSRDQFEALQSWSDEFIYNLYDTEIVSIRIYRGVLSVDSDAE